MIAQR